MNFASLDVLYEDNHLLVVNKPAGTPTMGTPKGTPTLLSAAKEYVKEEYHKPGNVYLGVVSRLDAPVTGVMLFARTSKAARRLNEQFRTRAVEKVYWALVEGIVKPAVGECVDFVAPDKRHRRMHIVERELTAAKEARLSYRRLQVTGGNSLLEVTLETGRKHQIRIQMSHRGWPIVGDRKYGSRRRWSSGIALHARRLVIAHPTKGDVLQFEAPLPVGWRSTKLDG